MRRFYVALTFRLFMKFTSDVSIPLCLNLPPFLASALYLLPFVVVLMNH